MNYKRMAVAAAAAFVAAMAYEIAVFGLLLQDLHRPHYGSLLVPEGEINNGAMFGWTLVGAVAISFFYAQFAKGRNPGWVNGALFGACLGMVAAVVPQAYNGIFLKAWPFFPHWALAGFAEQVFLGIVLGLTYRE